jgi:hypothetical protein
MAKDQPTNKWNQVFVTVPSFTPDIVGSILKKARIPDFKTKSITDNFESITTELNYTYELYYTLKHQSEKPTPATVRKELEHLQKRSESYYSTIENLNTPAKTQIGIERLENLQRDLINLQFNTELAIDSIEPKSGRSKSFLPSVIAHLSVLYKDLTGRKPRRSVKNNKPIGPFFRFVKLCLAQIDPSQDIKDFALEKHIRSALDLRDKYLDGLNSWL